MLDVLSEKTHRSNCIVQMLNMSTRASLQRGTHRHGWECIKSVYEPVWYSGKRVLVEHYEEVEEERRYSSPESARVHSKS